MIIDLGDINKAVVYKENGVSNCLELCKMILRKYGITEYGLSSHVIKLMHEVNGKLVHYGNNIMDNYRNAIKCIDRHLEKGRPIIVGVNYKIGKGINEGSTDHFVVVYGKGYDDNIKCYYYTYYEVGKGNITDVYNNDKNRFIYNIDKYPYLYDNESNLGGGSRFDITQVRPNDGILDGTVSQYLK